MNEMAFRRGMGMKAVTARLTLVFATLGCLSALTAQAAEPAQSVPPAPAAQAKQSPVPAPQATPTEPAPATPQASPTPEASVTPAPGAPPAEQGLSLATVWDYHFAEVGGQPITLRNVTVALVLLVLGFVIARQTSRMLRRRILPHVHIDPAAANTVQALIYYFLLAFFAVFALAVANVPLTVFQLLGGALAIGVGFGSQNIVNNFISGLILMFERTIQPGDIVEVEGTTGTVQRIGARSTRIRTGSNADVIIPNSIFLEKNVVNWTLGDDRVRTLTKVSVAYGSPTREVASLIRRAVDEDAAVLRDPEPIVLFSNFGDSTLEFEVHFWLRLKQAFDRRKVESQIRFRLEELFRAANITMAYPQRDLHLRSALPLEVHLTETGARSPAPEPPPGPESPAPAKED